ncbi:MAG TPA: amino acid adenylation domain-containing protein [Actinocrinis sp.]|nr:amino acid adenylation domain-containing protein [Actinocrinis sp.]
MNPGLSLHGLFEAQAARTPEATAVVSGRGRLGYAALDARAAAVAGRLRAAGAGPDDVVAIALDRSADLVAAMLAVLKTGAAFLPIDTAYPAGHIAAMLEDGRPALVLTASATAHLLPETSRLLVLDGPGDGLSHGSADGPSDGPSSGPAEPTPAPEQEILPDQAAYVIYTSGSTGRPKGVVISHRAITNYLAWQLAEYPLTPADRFIQKSPTGFDGAVLEFFLPLCAGAAVVLARPDGHREPEYIAELIAREKVTLAQFVPSMLPVFLGDDLAPLCRTLRRVYSASDTLSAAVRERFHQRLDAELVNLYGPTEAAVDAAHWLCPPDPGPGEANPPVGAAVANMRVEVLDARLRRVPALQEGEIYLSGIQLARGYLGRSGLTAERFVADPYGGPGERMYRTGDLGRWRADGLLEFAGRADGQVKIGGVRVEPAQIEAALAGHPGVRLAAAKTVPAPAGERRLAAYVVPVDQGTLTPDGLRRFLRERLPAAMVPAYVLFLDDIPLTPNEKLDRACLPMPDFDDAEPDFVKETQVQANAGDAEQAFYSLVREVLGVPRATEQDSVIGLGGDSITAINLASRARQAGFGITTGDVLRHKTLGDLLRAGLAAPAGTGASAAGDQEGVGPFPPTPIMHWLDEQGGPIDAFSQSMVLRTPADLREAELLDCLQTLIDRHDMLRARFPGLGQEGAGQPEVLKVGAVSAVSLLEAVDADGIADNDLRDLIRSGLERSRDHLSLSEPKLLHAIWYQYSDGRPGRLAILVNHLAIDGVSLRVLQADLAEAWRSLRRTGTAQVAPVPVSFRRWAGLLEQEARSPRRSRELTHWLAATAAGAAPLARRGLDRSDTLATARIRRFDLPAGPTGVLLGRAPGVLGVDVNTLLVTGLALALAEWREPDPAAGPADPATAATPDFLIAMEGHGREPVFPGLDPGRTVGWFTTMFPVRISLDGIQTRPTGSAPSALRRAVHRVGAQLAAIPDHGFGYGLLRHLNPDTGARLADRPGRPELLLNHLGRFAEADAADWALDAEHDVAMDEADGATPLAFPIEVNSLAMPRGGGQVLSAVWQWADSAVGADEVARLAELWFARLTDLAHLAEQIGQGEQSAPSESAEPAASPLRSPGPVRRTAASAEAESEFESDFRAF